MINKSVLSQIETPQQIARAHSVKGLVGLPNISHILVLYSPMSTKFTKICGDLGCVKCKAQRQGQNPPPIADSTTRCERINYGDNSHIFTGHSLVNQQPMRTTLR